jgi:hypothetical protein
VRCVRRFCCGLSLLVGPQPLNGVPARSSRRADKSIDVQEILTETAEKVGAAWEETEDKARGARGALARSQNNHSRARTRTARFAQRTPARARACSAPPRSAPATAGARTHAPCAPRAAGTPAPLRAQPFFFERARQDL